MADQEPRSVEQPEDALGARLLHALLLANTPESSELFLHLADAHPHLLLGTSETGEYAGQGALHIIAVNRDANMLQRTLAIAKAKPDAVQMIDLLSQATTGTFFQRPPMRFFGGTAFAFIGTFGMLHVLDEFVEDPQLRDTLHTIPCPISGYLPLHAATVLGQKPSFNLLCDTFGADEFGVDEQGLTPLKLAAKLGLHAMFRHVLGRRAVVVWRWGPVTSYMLPLAGIDTEGKFGMDTVMEIMAEEDARETTQKMLLDSFMKGFIFQLFEAKWTRWVRYASFSLLFNEALLAIALSLLASPTLLGYYASDVFVRSSVPPVVTACIASFYVAAQVTEAISLLHVHITAALKRKEKAISLRAWFFNSFVHSRIDNWTLVVTSLYGVACLLSSEVDEQGNRLSATWQSVRLAFALAQAAAWYQLFINGFLPFRKLGVFAIIVMTIMRDDFLV
eukprot:2909890-Prymnesium_polylepis.1